jgi:glycosyltransferase involved in cell wall biosynthesis
MSRHYAIDAFAVRNGRCFGWGWFLDEHSPVERCALVVPLRDGREQRVPCLFSGMREDLRTAFPTVRHAAAAGFMIHGRLVEAPLPDVPGHLDVLLRDGRRDRCEVPASVLGTLAAVPPASPAGMRSAFAAFRRKSVDIGLFPAIVHAMRRLMRVSTTVDRTGPDRVLARLSSLAGERTVLVFDHDMGGGANRYRNDSMAQWLVDGRHVVLIVPQLDTLDYRIAIHAPGAIAVEEGRVDDPLAALAALGRCRDLEIRVNELVSFHDPLAVLDGCVAARASGAGRLVFHLHDYHAVCPAWTLIDSDGRYCGVPSLERCRACLPANLANTLGFSADADLAEWRARWSAFLGACDEIVAFSNASVDILRKGHPALEPARVAVRPHRVDNARLRAVTPNPGPPVVIAVAGHISRPKGADMLLEMAEAIRRDALPARIVVFGTLEGHCDDSGIEVRGRFEPAALPALLESCGATVCLLPSICPETFSFVTDEYMAMRMPVAVFPIGAPAERVAAYADGLVISRIDAATAVREILEHAGRARATGAA